MAQQADTKERILDAAEALFSEHGFVNTSMRSITQSANVNLAAVNYHFGSKEELIKAVFARRLLPLNEERIRRLDDVLAQGVTLERLLEAFIAPHLELSQDHEEVGDRFVRLIGRGYTDHAEFLRDHIHQLNKPCVARFKEAFAAELPHLPRKELSWRLHFLVGAVAHTMAGPDMIRLMAGRRISDHGNAQALVQRLIPFLAAGLQAPLPESLPDLELRHAG
ncbi:TetR/AcrR family transcriptional regulator [Alkalilimnicola ehrlichii]|uniref:TetR/AcrR family transcriptional regulator n=1 Tax=Alkalilimnicola ehrlichii TaxID=351052 RepID=UPI0015F24D78|nr:TetR/AcrR family transcriptional regulator [Alkalilimnicola ehrlichii]